MKKTIKLSENELIKIIQKVIKEQDYVPSDYSPVKKDYKKEIDDQTQKSLNDMKTLLVNKTINMTPVFGNKKYADEQYKVLSVYMETPTIKIKKDGKKIFGTIFIGLKPISNTKRQEPFEVTAYIDSTDKYNESLITPFFEYTDIRKQSIASSGLENSELANTLTNIIQTNFLR